jgi:hypothetical protein
MKNKLLFITILGFLIAGVVSAATSWGEYKGNSIVHLTVNGVDVAVSDVPAFSFDNRTMVPIYLLKQAGINYSYDADTQTVDIITPTQTPEATTEPNPKPESTDAPVLDAPSSAEPSGDQPEATPSPEPTPKPIPSALDTPPSTQGPGPSGSNEHVMFCLAYAYDPIIAQAHGC